MPDPRWIADMDEAAAVAMDDMTACARCGGPIGHQAEPGDEPLCPPCVDFLVSATTPPPSYRVPRRWLYTVYAMRRYAYGALLESAALVIDRRTNATYYTTGENGHSSESVLSRREAARTLASWRRDAASTRRRDAASYPGHDDSDRPRVELARAAFRGPWSSGRRAPLDEQERALWAVLDAE